MANPQKSEPLIRNVSDTARWVAVYRAQETERPDPIFRDPFARKLAGERGEQIAKLMPLGADNSWSMITRTYLIDELIKAELQRGADLVVNLAAGLDSRPYRMPLSPSLRWVEVDLPEILDYKESICAMKNRCARSSVSGSTSRTSAKGVNCLRAWAEAPSEYSLSLRAW